MSTDDTARVARAYFEAWSERRGPDALRPLLAETFVFDAGPVHIEGREAFLGAAEWPARARTTLLAEAYDGEHAFQLYQAVNGTARIRFTTSASKRRATHMYRGRSRDEEARAR